MKEFVVLNNKNEVIDRAGARNNLTKDGEHNTTTIEFEGDFLILDKIENGAVVESTDPKSERMKNKKAKEDKDTLVNSIKVKLGLTDEELKLLVS